MEIGILLGGVALAAGVGGVVGWMVARAVRGEFASNRQEATALAKAQREELREMQDGFRVASREHAEANGDAVRKMFADLALQLDSQHSRALEAFKDVRETVDKQLKELRDDN
ncbi:MAG: hypothetical protein RJA19_742, partial [Bacteroidota bacterium]